MVKELDADICVIGAGSGGLMVAAGASQMGAKTVLIEAGKMGGDCLNFGCIPSKALLAAAHAAQSHRTSGRFGVNGGEPSIDFAAVHGRLHDVIAGIAPHDSPERYEGLGVTVVPARASFIASDRVEANGTLVRARRFVVATGSRAMIPPVPGLDDVPFLTNETVFESSQAPEHLIVLGGGPIGIELAQAHRRLGARVTVLEMQTMLRNDDPELVDILRVRLRAEGVRIHEGARVTRVERHGNGVAAMFEEDGAEHRIEGSHILVAAGRTPNVEGIGLDIAGIESGPRGIVTDRRMRTTNRKVYAIGDVAGPYLFTHTAAYQAGIVLRNALFRLPAKTDYSALPWVTFTDPELAQVGMTEEQARARHGSIRVLRASFAENDRARAEDETHGVVKAVVARNGRVLGASIIGPRAGELIQTWELAIRSKLKIGAIAGLIAPYPTFAEANKRAAGTFYLPRLFSDRTKMIVRFLARFG